MIREYIIKISDEVMEEEIAGKPQELIRCKDCKWYDKQKNWCITLDIAEQGEDWFCDDGERKEVK